VTEWSIDRGILTHIKEDMEMVACDSVYVDLETKTLAN